ncbi:MAG: DUF4388 domain-containing protein [Actinomycetota bacterium]|nr:DUF4388 domain-containing protein [Actinomycetota bacterium]
MPLKGNLKDFSLSDLFELVRLGKKTGTLNLRSKDATGRVYFRNGDVFFASSNIDRVPLGERLLQAGILTPDQLEEALDLQRTTRRSERLGEILVGLGFLERESLEIYVRQQIEEAVFNLLTWEDGEFDFDPNETSQDEDIGLSIDTESLMREASKRLEEWARIEEKVPSLDTVFEVEKFPGKKSEASLTSDEWLVFYYVDGKTDVRGIVEKSGETTRSVCKALYNLANAGFIKPIESGVLTSEVIDISSEERTVKSPKARRSGASRKKRKKAVEEIVVDVGEETPGEFVEVEEEEVPQKEEEKAKEEKKPELKTEASPKKKKTGPAPGESLVDYYKALALEEAARTSDIFELFEGEEEVSFEAPVLEEGEGEFRFGAAVEKETEEIADFEEPEGIPMEWASHLARFGGGRKARKSQKKLEEVEEALEEEPVAELPEETPVPEEAQEAVSLETIEEAPALEAEEGKELEEEEEIEAPFELEEVEEALEEEPVAELPEETPVPEEAQEVISFETKEKEIEAVRLEEREAPERKKKGILGRVLKFTGRPAAKEAIELAEVKLLEETLPIEKNIVAEELAVAFGEAETPLYIESSSELVRQIEEAQIVEQEAAAPLEEIPLVEELVAEEKVFEKVEQKEIRKEIEPALSELEKVTDEELAPDVHAGEVEIEGLDELMGELEILEKTLPELDRAEELEIETREEVLLETPVLEVVEEIIPSEVQEEEVQLKEEIEAPLELEEVKEILEEEPVAELPEEAQEVISLETIEEAPALEELEKALAEAAEPIAEAPPEAKVVPTEEEILEALKEEERKVKREKEEEEEAFGAVKFRGKRGAGTSLIDLESIEFELEELAELEGEGVKEKEFPTKAKRRASPPPPSSKASKEKKVSKSKKGDKEGKRTKGWRLR